MCSMKAKPKTSNEYATFENALRKVLQVSHSEMQTRIEDAKQERTQRRKRASVHASRAKSGDKD
jgi:predicted Co/Zn/Cd cation transporter (cation efflux family)